ncbi:hypothetical protein [Nocardia goodfellowii]|uniref:Mce-associated membrane protein n=1 Tax=Nocardia goodfellowii TaxID=882446 RepID=A0ABS4QMZ9_9NOCA|nr:hypothetical protein [Nocardia goodfellowii]MBP2193082.1 Mce-associated membrane protein [Nocardia goodfellowii]
MSSKETELKKVGGAENAADGVSEVVEGPEKTVAAADDDTKSIAGAKDTRSWTVTLPSISRAGRIAVRSAAVLLLAAAIASSVFLFQRNEHHKNLLAAEADARAAACAYAPVLVNYDAKKLDDYFTAVLAGATGEWRQQFDATSKDLREVLVQGEVVAKSSDVQCAIRTADENSAEAIVVVGQTITSLGTEGKPAPGQLSMVMRLERSGDRWLVNKLNSPMAQMPRS